MRIRFLVLFVSLLMVCLARAQVPYRTQFPLPASTSVTSWGINADINSLVADDPSIQSISDKGAKFLRVDLKWANVETVAGVYEFTYFDNLVALVQAKGMRPILIFDYGNPLYNAGNAPSTDESRSAFVAYCAAALDRYKGKGVLWEVWNEPNEVKFWKPLVNADDYATLAIQVCQMIRSTAPDEWIIGPGLSGFDWPFVERCFQRGLLQYWDAVSVHPYRSQLPPETALADYEKLRVLIEQYRPPGRSVAIVQSEWGYSLGWVGMDPDVHARLVVRSKIVDMLAGARTSITYSWRDQGTNPDNVSVFGLHDTLMVERPAAVAYKVFANALKGNKLITRLDIGSPNDYCVMFVSGTTVKLVAWTTGPAHAATLPSSPGSFAGNDMLGNPISMSTATPGLPVMLTDRPIVLRNTSSNPLLKTLINWGRLPTSGVVGDVPKLQKLISPAVVGSWSHAPDGTTIMIQNTPSPDQLFSLASTSSTFGNVKTLTMDAPEMQLALANDPRRIDLTEGPRTLRVIVTTPDGASASQSCLLYHPAPVRLTVQTPQSNQLVIKADNVSGQIFQGGVKALSNNIFADSDLTFASGQLTKSFFISTIGRADAQVGLQMQVLQAAAFQPGLLGMMPNAWTALVNRMPDPWVGGYFPVIEGSAHVNATANLTVATAPGGAGITGMKCLKLVYSFTAGTKSIVMRPPSSVSSVFYPGRAHSLGMWIFSDGSRNKIRVRFADTTEQVFDTPPTVLDWTGWRFISVPLNGAGTTWSGGAADGIVHWPVRIVAPAILVSQGTASGGTIYVAGPTFVSATA